MEYYQEGPPRHGHRSPSELAEDEMLSSFSEKFCGMPANPEDLGRIGPSSARLKHVALLVVPKEDQCSS
jgi:hypothetical protein